MNTEMTALRYEEIDIQERLKEEPKVIDGKLDFTEYQKLMQELREVRAKMASL